MYFDHCQSKINYGIILLGNSTNLNKVNLKKKCILLVYIVLQCTGQKTKFTYVHYLGMVIPSPLHKAQLVPLHPRSAISIKLTRGEQSLFMTPHTYLTETKSLKFCCRTT